MEKNKHALLLYIFTFSIDIQFPISGNEIFSLFLINCFSFSSSHFSFFIFLIFILYFLLAPPQQPPPLGSKEKKKFDLVLRRAFPREPSRSLPRPFPVPNSAGLPRPRSHCVHLKVMDAAACIIL